MSLILFQAAGACRAQEEDCETVRAKPPTYRPPTEVVPGIFLVPIPIPIPLRYVNCYLLRDPSGWTLVDTGFHDSLALDAWPRALADLAIRPQDIRQIVLTHYHPDHVGAAGWLQQLTGAPVFLPETEMEQFQRFWADETGSMAERLTAMCLEEGMDEATALALGRHHLQQVERVRPLPELRPLPIGSQIAMGGGTWEVIWTPGHSDGLAVFWDARRSILLANDMLLAGITPNVSVWPGSRPDPLADYLYSLRRVEALGAKVALPGHRALIHDVAGRAREIAAHHVDRLAKVAAAADAAPGGATAWEVCRRIFPVEELTLHQIRFALAETLAHLVYLCNQGRLRKTGMHYRAAA